MSPVCFGCHAAITYFKHIRIVPFARTGISGKIFLPVKNIDHAVPVITDISGGPPEVANTSCPFPWFVTSPLAYTEYDRSARRVKSIAHVGVRRFCILGGRT